MLVYSFICYETDKLSKKDWDMEFEFEELCSAKLIVDAIYKGGRKGNTGDDPISKLFPKLGNMSGFRKVSRNDKSNKLAYVVLYTTMAELEWPDYLDVETGVFRYYGDNRKPGNDITNTKQGGNKLLEEVFSILNSNSNIEDIPPFFIFKKVGTKRDVQFLGMAAPGNPNISPDKDLVAFWRTMGDNRFQNYEAYFTILDTKNETISREWLQSLIDNHDNNLELAPAVWKEFVKNGRSGIKPLKAPRIRIIPSKYDQLQCSEDGKKCLAKILEHYKNNPAGFEACAVSVALMMDNNFESFNLTRPWRDGGRDAIGYYSIKNGNTVNAPLKIDCALEAKCYDGTAVGVKQMSRLISRIRYRQFGILVTTSYVDSQAYGEVVDDGHPILIVTGSDIAYILARNTINSSNIDVWLDTIDHSMPRDNTIR